MDRDKSLVLLAAGVFCHCKGTVYHYAGRAEKLGLDRFILYGSGEEPTDSSREDMMEALIGSVAVDSGWNQEALEGVVDRMLCVQLTYPDRFLKATHYDLFNAWHLKKAAYMVLARLLKAAGICEKSWEEKMWEDV